MDEAKKAKAMEQMAADLTTDEFREQMEKAEQLAKVLVKHVANEKGEILAHVEENPGFQEVYDYRGGQARQHRLDRKREEVAWNMSAGTHLFQKTYYATGLTMSDEKQLRAAFMSANASHEQRDQLLGAGMFLGFWPAAYAMSRQAKPATVFMFGAAWYAGWKYGLQPFSLQMLQNGLNKAAEPIA